MTYLTKEEIVEKEYARLTEEDFKAINALTDSIVLHHGYGTWIRNEYKLWEAAHPATQPWFRAGAEAEDGKHEYIDADGVDCHPNHPDQVSMDIINAIIEKAKRRNV